MNNFISIEVPGSIVLSSQTTNTKLNPQGFSISSHDGAVARPVPQVFPDGGALLVLVLGGGWRGVGGGDGVAQDVVLVEFAEGGKGGDLEGLAGAAGAGAGRGLYVGGGVDLPGHTQRLQGE